MTRKYTHIRAELPWSMLSNPRSMGIGLGARWISLHFSSRPCPTPLTTTASPKHSRHRTTRRAQPFGRARHPGQSDSEEAPLLPRRRVLLTYPLARLTGREQFHGCALAIRAARTRSVAPTSRFTTRNKGCWATIMSGTNRKRNIARRVIASCRQRTARGSSAAERIAGSSAPFRTSLVPGFRWAQWRQKSALRRRALDRNPGMSRLPERHLTPSPSGTTVKSSRLRESWARRCAWTRTSPLETARCSA